MPKQVKKKTKSRNRNRGTNGLALARRGEPAAQTNVSGLGFPQSMLANLRYCDDYAISISSGTTNLQLMRWNSTFDPDATGIGHQPMYRDTFANIYNFYAVVSAYAEVTFVNTSTVPLLVGVTTDDDLTAPTDARQLMESARGQHKLLPPQSGSLSSVTMNTDWDCKKILHVDPFTSDAYKTATGSNPSKESSLVMWATTVDGSSATGYINLTLVQHTHWTELTNMGIS
jgi:hypothetical protein